MVILEQQREEDQDEERDKNSAVKWETKKEILLLNIVFNKNAKLSVSASTILQKKRKLDCVFEWGDSNENWDVEEIHHSDLPMLPINIKRILCKHDCSMVPT